MTAKRSYRMTANNKRQRIGLGPYDKVYLARRLPSDLYEKVWSMAFEIPRAVKIQRMIRRFWAIAGRHIGFSLDNVGPFASGRMLPVIDLTRD